MVEKPTTSNVWGCDGVFNAANTPPTTTRGSFTRTWSTAGAIGFAYDDVGGGTNQRWEFVNGTLRTQNNKCMDVAWGSTNNGAAIQIAGCSGNAAQQFVFTAAGDLVNPQANKSVDVADWNPNNDAVLQLWDCSGGANQKWRRG